MDDVRGAVDVTALLSEAERGRLFAALAADDHAAADPLFDLAETRAQEANPEGHETSLHVYWLTGAGSKRIRWRRPGAFTRCVEEVSGVDEAKRDLKDVKAYCANLYHEATGEWPGKKGKKKGGKVPKAAAEAQINGRRSYSDVQALVAEALRVRAREDTATGYTWVYVVDLTADQVVYGPGSSDGQDVLHQCSYTVAADGAVTLGEPTAVVRTYTAATGMFAEAVEASAPMTELGRVLEARADAPDGGRVFAVQIIRAGDSANRRRYPAPVLEAAAQLYEGARVYDHHRDDGEMRSSTISGMVGSIRNVTASADGLAGELHLLPRATHAADVLDASVRAQEAALPALAGLSQDAMARFRSLAEGGIEVTEITAVNSVDIVAVPAAGGRATRVLAGGADPPGIPETGTAERPADAVRDAAASTTTPASAGHTQEDTVPVTAADVLAALREADDATLAAAGLARATPVTEAAPPDATRVVEATYARDSLIGASLIRAAIERAHLPLTVVESITPKLAEQFTEADLVGQVDALVGALAIAERAQLTPAAPTAQVTREAREKKAAAIFGMLDPSGRADGYMSLREAWADYTGVRVLSWGEDINRRILRESHGGGYDSHGRIGASAAHRSTESLDSTSWAQVLGDSITRQAIALYSQPELQSWQKIVSTFGAPQDFRQQKRIRIGGYGLLPTVTEGQPYQPLQSPGDEEAVYSVIKRGGTEDLTWETVVNDDIGKVREIPRRLGLAAAITIYRYVWDMLKDNATCTYDSTALFHTDHANTDTGSALATGTLAVARRKMREQSAYGDTLNLLSVANIPKLLVVPNELEVLAWQIANSVVQLPSGAPVGAASDIPNIHRGLDVEVIDYWTDADDWIAVANGGGVPLIEVGFLQGRREPELFTQSDPTQGASFDADIAVTYKLRHIYAGTVLDHRGFYRGQG